MWRVSALRGQQKPSGELGLLHSSSSYKVVPTPLPLPEQYQRKPFHLFPRTTITNDHKFSGLKWQELILSHFWRPEICNQVASRATLTIKALEGNPSLPFVASGGSICSLTYDNVTPTSGSVFTQLSSVCLFVSSPLLIRTASLDSGPALNPGWFNFNILN